MGYIRIRYVIIFYRQFNIMEYNNQHYVTGRANLNKQYGRIYFGSGNYWMFFCRRCPFSCEITIIQKFRPTYGI